MRQPNKENCYEDSNYFSNYLIDSKKLLSFPKANIANTNQQIKNSKATAKKPKFSITPNVMWANYGNCKKHQQSFPNESQLQQLLYDDVSTKQQKELISFGAEKQKLVQILKNKSQKIQKLNVCCNLQKTIKEQSEEPIMIKQKSPNSIEKAQIFTQIKQLKRQYNTEIYKLQNAIKLYDEYQKLISKRIQQQNAVFDAQSQEKLLQRNIENQVAYLFKLIEEQTKRNAKQIKKMNSIINNSRIAIVKKQKIIRQLKTKICTMHIKMHRGTSQSTTKRNLSFSAKKGSRNNVNVQEIFIGNKVFKKYSRQVSQKIIEQNQLEMLKFYVEKDQQKQGIQFQCVFSEKKGKMHSSYKRQQQICMTDRIEVCQITVKSILSLKIFFSSKIIGIQFRIKGGKENKEIRIGDCHKKAQHELITLINKKLCSISSFWHQSQMIGLSLWCIRQKIAPNICRRSKSRSVTKDVKAQYYG